jgi:hypothetical protein
MLKLLTLDLGGRINLLEIKLGRYLVLISDLGG